MSIRWEHSRIAANLRSAAAAAALILQCSFSFAISRLAILACFSLILVIPAGVCEPLWFVVVFVAFVVTIFERETGCDLFHFIWAPFGLFCADGAFIAYLFMIFFDSFGQASHKSARALARPTRYPLHSQRSVCNSLIAFCLN